MKKPGNDLRARTLEFALRIVRMFGSLPRTTSALIIGKQVLRSGTSVGANYREAYRGRSKAEFVAKLPDRMIDEYLWLLQFGGQPIHPLEHISDFGPRASRVGPQIRDWFIRTKGGLGSNKTNAAHVKTILDKIQKK